MAMMKFKSIRFKTLAITIMGVILLTILFTSMYSLFTKDVVLDVLEESNYKHVESYADIIGNWLQERVNEIELYASSAVVRNMEWSKIQSYLQMEMAKKSDTYSILFVANTDGDYHTNIKTDAGNLSHRDYFPRVMAGENVLSNPLISLSTGSKIVVVAVPIKSLDGEVIGLMGGAIDLVKMYRFVEGFESEDLNSYSYIADKTGLIITHPNRDLIMRENITILSEDVNTELVEASKKILSEEKGRVLYTYNDIESDAYFHVIPHTDGWRIISKIPTYYVKEPMTRIYVLLGLTGILVVLLGVIGSLIFTDQNTKPIIELKEVFDKAAKGDLTIRAAMNYNDEIGEAGKSFNIMMDKISSLTYYDPITELPNRNYFAEELEVELAHRQSDEKKLSVVLLTLSKFKSVNDMYGFGVGDKVLKTAGERIKEVTGQSNKVARMSGDEFIILFYEMGAENEIIKKTEEVLEEMNKPFVIQEHTIHIYGTAGIVFYPEDGKNVDTLLKNVSIAKLQAKEKGSNQYQIYNENMNQKLSEELMMERALYEALENQEFLLEYQPFIDMKTNKIVEAEALIRWSHPQKGIIPPGLFIPLAEKTGLIVSIGNWVLREACKQNKLWQTKEYKPIIMSVNISVLQFEREDFVNTVESILLETGLDPQYLALEITEGIAMKNVEENIDKLQSLKKIGVKISIDDFGTGFSSLNYFTRFPIDSLKIDRSFIQSIEHSQEARAIVSMIISMGRSLGIENIAEGIETEGQLNIIRKENCHKAQGYFFSKPTNPGAFQILLADDKEF
ncbi:diguanylate cyclase (GGDEF) domain-containing protein [Anaerovirgula multivorans]|uniref:Diguanylate cyclase (GGDEF) domain-containing protein n=1 Tax=Anaerovirgula multivorans TaxID=312168 RepID=A0A239H1F3_9FIRM|nr:EAL domain-containing protein [Anaerovirgula multivorans]SNS74955.1 diguanylate cyclase (GGDEF) domain-containing protein [Anaerovirgula multivorans]